MKTDLRNLVSSLLSEVALYGGLPLRRADIYRLACEDLGERSREPFGAWYFALHGEKLEGVEPWTLEEARELFNAN